MISMIAILVLVNKLLGPGWAIVTFFGMMIFE